MKLISNCICGHDSFVDGVHLEIPVRTCQSCGVIHQNLDMTPQEYFAFYANDYHGDFQKQRGTQTYEQRYKHDSEVSAVRFEKYAPYMASGRTLDIGSSNNAFVDLLRSKGFDAYGVEIGEEGKKHPATTYTDDLLGIHFPHDYFSFITIHDVLEHFIDPVPYVEELRKIVSPDGTVVIDFPNFFDPAGVHHWKRIEHLWFLSIDQVKGLFESHGFDTLAVDIPIPSKVVFYFRKRPSAAKPTKLLFMPGMGDIYWCLTKVEDFIRRKKLQNVESYIWDIDESKKNIGGHQRSEGWLSRFTFMNYKGTLNRPTTQTFREFYEHKDRIGAEGKHRIPGREGKWYVKNAEGFDYIFNMNGYLELGESIVDGKDQQMYKYATNWRPQFFTPVDEDVQQAEYEWKYGRYVVGYFTGTGVYEGVFNSTLTPERVYRIAERIHECTGCVLVLTGTTWDKDNADKILALDTKGIVKSEVLNTTTSQLLSLMKGSKAVFGWPAGNTIVAASMFRIPTLIVWSAAIWHRDFAIRCVDPAALDGTNAILYVEDYAQDFDRMAEVAAEKLVALIGDSNG